jgi:N-acetylglucosamine malate deacetylase 1
MKLDILAFAAHPDDVELSCSGTIIKHIRAGKKVGIVDLSRGELGTRGTALTRKKEAKAASKILGISARENLGFADGFFENNKQHQLEIVKMIRHYQPEIILANAISDRHPDHAKLVSDSCFISALTKVKTSLNNKEQKAWRVKSVYHYIQDWYIKPDLVIDITDEMEQRMKAVMAFKTQFYNPQSKAPGTPISSLEFIDSLYAKATLFGRSICVKYAEGFTVERTPGVDSLFDLK